MTPELSVVIPVHNEAATLDPLHREFTDTLTQLGPPVRDSHRGRREHATTASRCCASCRLRDPRLRVIRFRRNFGQTAAFAAGFDPARGRLIATSDGDLPERSARHPGDGRQPRERLRHRLRLAEGSEGRVPVARLPSVIANRLISSATGVQSARLRLFSEGVPRRKSSKPLQPVRRDAPRSRRRIASERACAIAEAVVNHRERDARPSKYGICGTVRVVLDLLTVKFLVSYSTRPVQIFGSIGFAMAVPGAAILAWLGYVRLTGRNRSAEAYFTVWHPAHLHGRAADYARPAGRADFPHVRRIAGQARLPSFANNSKDAPLEKTSFDADRCGGSGRTRYWVGSTHQKTQGLVAFRIEIRRAKSGRGVHIEQRGREARAQGDLDDALFARMKRQVLMPRGTGEANSVFDAAVSNEQAHSAGPVALDDERGVARAGDPDAGGFHPRGPAKRKQSARAITDAVSCLAIAGHPVRMRNSLNCADNQIATARASPSTWIVHPSKSHW